MSRKWIDRKWAHSWQEGTLTVTEIHSRPNYDILSALITVFRISGCQTGSHIAHLFGFWITISHFSKQNILLLFHLGAIFCDKYDCVAFLEPLDGYYVYKWGVDCLSACLTKHLDANWWVYLNSSAFGLSTHTLTPPPPPPPVGLTRKSIKKKNKR